MSHLLGALFKATTFGGGSFTQTLQLMPEMAEEISHASQVIFVDASVEGTPGAIHVEKLRVEHRPPLNYTHYVAPKE